VAFEGGGAKGIAHIGALRAVEALSAEVRAYAGTSAGSIIAALAAAGYTSRDILHAEKRSSIVTVLNEGLEEANRLRAAKGFPPLPLYADATDMLGSADWNRLSAWAGLGQTVASMPTWLKLLLCGSLAGIVIWLFSFQPQLLLLLLAGAAGLAALLGWWLLTRGIATLDGFETALDRALALRIRGPAGLAESETVRPVTFEEFRHSEATKPLKVVATDITSRRVRVFSAETQPNLPVARAVAASACIPLVFGPRHFADDPDDPAMEKHYFFDGGLVSNLPAWVFDDERTVDPEAYTLAVALDDTAATDAARTEQPKADGLFGGIVSTVRTAIFGSDILNTRGIAKLYPVKLPSAKLSLLEFDATWEKASEVVSDATAVASTRIGSDIFDTRRIYREACDGIRGFVEQAMAERAGLFVEPGFKPRVRVAVALAESTDIDLRVAPPRLLRLRHGVGFESDADAGMTLPIDGSTMGYVWQTGEPVLRFANPRASSLAEEPDLPDGERLAGDENIGRRNALRRDITWLIASPFRFDFPERPDGPPDVVVSVDGNGHLDWQHEADAIGRLAVETHGQIQQKMQESAEILGLGRNGR
jgi:NTE family protein